MLGGIRGASVQFIPDIFFLKLSERFARAYFDLKFNLNERNAVCFVYFSNK